MSAGDWLDGANLLLSVLLLAVLLGPALADARQRAGIAVCRIATALTFWRVLHRPWRLAWQQARARHPWPGDA